MPSIKEILEAIRLPLEVVFTVFIASCICLFLPDNVLEFFCVRELIEENRSIIGLIFLLSVAIITVKIGKIIFIEIKEKYDKYSLKKKQCKVLEDLNNEQTFLVVALLNKSDHTLDFDVYNGNVVRLTQLRVISRLSNTAIVSDIRDISIPHILNQWVIKRIEENAKLQEKFEVSQFILQEEKDVV